MARTPSTMLQLGTRAPDFSLEDVVTGDTVTRDGVREEHGLLVMFLSNHCPFVKHVAPKLADLTRDYMNQGVGVVGIMSNDVENYPDDHPDRMREEVENRGYAFPYLYDGTQNVAHAYRAACTPDFFLFDRNLELAYRGQLDASRPGNDVPVTGEDLTRAVQALVKGQAVPGDQKPSLGCNIKWKPGNEPDYHG